jgi:beta-glucosidase
VLARVALDLALLPGNWAPDGSVRNETAVLLWLNVAVSALTHTTRDTYAQNDALVSVLRDLAQRAIIQAGTRTPGEVAGLTASADQALAAGHPDTAMALLGRAYLAARRAAR